MSVLMKNETKKLSYIEGIGSIAINVILFILKYWVGIMTGSIAIIADAFVGNPKPNVTA